MPFIEANGIGLRYDLSGSGERTLVLIHEMGGTLESWDEVAPKLAKGRRVLRYDTRGAGLSHKARGTLHIDTMADDLAALLDALRIDGKVALAGIAVGGAIALHSAVRHADRVGAVVVGSPATGIPAERRAGVLARIDNLEREGTLSAVNDTMTNSYPVELRGDAARFAATRARWLGNDPGSYAAVYRMLASTDLASELPRIACPVLVLAGALDRTRPPTMVEPVARGIPGARYRVLETGHYMSVITPELITVAIGDFLAEVGA